MKAKDAQVGHFYALDISVIFLVGYPDEVKDSIHAWYYNRGSYYFYDKHLFNDVEIKEIYPNELYKVVISGIFGEDDYFAKNF